MPSTNWENDSNPRRAPYTFFAYNEPKQLQQNAWELLRRQLRGKKEAHTKHTLRTTTRCSFPIHVTVCILIDDKRIALICNANFQCLIFWIHLWSSSCEDFICGIQRVGFTTTVTSQIGYSCPLFRYLREHAALSIFHPLYVAKRTTVVLNWISMTGI